MDMSHFMTDSTLILADDQAVTATAISANVINTGADLSAGAVPGAARGRGIPVGQSAALPNQIFRAGTPILIKVTTTFATLTSLTVTLESSAAAGLTSATTHWSSGAIAAATLVQGYAFKIQHVPEADYLQYVGLRFTVGGSNATAGTIHAEIGRNASSGENGAW